MSTPRPRTTLRRPRPVVVALGACALLWVACTVAVVWLGSAAETAEHLRHTDPGYAGPAQDDLETWLVLPLYLGAGALVAGVCLAAVEASRRRAAVAASPGHGPA